jgi:hypothetical protein
MVGRSKHPDKDIEASVQYAEPKIGLGPKPRATHGVSFGARFIPETGTGYPLIRLLKMAEIMPTASEDL